MPKWAIVLLALGPIAGVLAFTPVVGASFAIAKILFFVFPALLVLFLILGVTATRRLTR